MRNRADYLIRMIEAAARILSIIRDKILGRVAAPGEVEKALRQAGGMVGVDLDMARVATPETLTMIVSPSGEIDTSRCFIAAEMLYIDGLDAAQEGRYETSRGSWDRAKRLYQLLEPRGSFLVGWPEAAQRIAEIDEHLKKLPAS